MANRLKTILQQQICQKNWNLIKHLKYQRVKSHITFLKQCKYHSVIPNGFICKNKLLHTLNSSKGELLALQHAKQWMKIAISELYAKKTCYRVYSAYFK